MADYKLTLAERETVILWSEADDTVRIDTFSQKLINRLRKAKAKSLSFTEWTSQTGMAVYMQKFLKGSFRSPCVSRSVRNADSTLQGQRQNAPTPKTNQGCKRCKAWG